MSLKFLFKHGNDAIFKALAIAPSLISMPTRGGQAVEEYFFSKCYEYFFAVVDIDDGSLKTSPEEWHDSPRCISSAIVISISTLGGFIDRDLAPTEDYHSALGKELGRDAVYLASSGGALQVFMAPTRSPSPRCSGLQGLSILPPITVGKWKHARFFDLDISTSLLVSANRLFAIIVDGSPQ